MQQQRKGAAGAPRASGRAPQVAPVAKAIRIALAASATAFALAGSGAAFAQTCSAPAGGAVYCDGDFTVPVLYDNVDDLTLVLGENAPTTITVNSEIGARIVGNGDIGLRSDATVSVTGKYGPSKYTTVGLYAASGDGAATLDNTGQVTVSGMSADGLFASGADASIANAGLVEASGFLGAIGIEGEGGGVAIGNAGNVHAEGYLVATGILAEGAGDVGIGNSGAIYASATAYDATNGKYGHATGIDASGDTVAIDNSGLIVTDGTYSTGIYAYASGTGGIAIANGGDIGALAQAGFASGITAISAVEGSDIQVDNSGAIDVAGMNRANGIDVLATGLGSSASVTNSGSILATTPIGTPYAAYYQAEGVMVSADGDARIENTAAGAIEVVGGGQAYGAAALAFAGDASVVNAGSVSVGSYGYGPAVYGVLASSANGIASVDNSGSILAAGGLYYASGIAASGHAGAQVANSGVIDAGTPYGVYGVFGIQADSAAGDVSIVNTEDGGILAHAGYGAGFGVLGIASAGDVDVDNAGSLSAYGSSQGAGIFAVARQGDARVVNSGEIFADSGAHGVAVGAFARADYGMADIAGSGTIHAASDYIAYGALARGANGDIDNSGDVTANGGSLALGLIASATGNAAVSNSGTVTTLSYGGSIGIHADGGGDIAVDNAGTLGAVSQYGLADGIFASGANVDVGNSGNIAATGFDWAVGIEAEAEGGSTTVVSSGDIVAVATSLYAGYYGHAYGIYASGSQITVDNGGAIAAAGVYATGIQALATAPGAVTVTNSGTIDAGAYTIYAAGIRATSAYEGASVAVDNSGSIAATSLFGSSGIEAIATGEGATALAGNSGTITVDSSEYYANTSGIVVSADAGATASNSGAIAVTYADYAYGAQALTFNGDAVVDNAGTVEVTGGFVAYGALAASTNGTGAVTSSGDLDVAATHPQGTATGIGASGNTAASVANAGSIAVGGGKYDSGVAASSPAGEVAVDNSGTVATDGKYAWGVRATSAEGDVRVDNSGAIAATGSLYATGIAATSGSGTVAAVNAGDIDATGSGFASAYAIKAVTDAGGDIAIENAAGGTASASAHGGAAFGIGALAAAGGDVEIVNAGDVVATGSTYIGYYGGTYGSTGATAVFGRADAGDVVIDNGGAVLADNPYASAEGVVALATGGMVAIANRGQIRAVAGGQGGAYAPDYSATGVEASSDAAVTIANSGDIAAESAYGMAYGVHVASAGRITVTNAGAITVNGSAAAVGVSLDGPTATLVNSGTIRTFALDDGRIAVWGGGGVETIDNAGSIHGAVLAGGGDDRLVNRRGGAWFVDNGSTDFGDGDDAIVNAVGGTIRLEGGAIDLGAGAGNRFDNAGTIAVSGASLIHMGTGAAAAQPGMAAMPAVNAVPSLNAAPLVNSGLIDFADGASDDRLTIVGDLGGTGSVDIDVDTTAGTADQLLVDGSIAEGAVQIVNVAFNGFEVGDGGGVPLDFASVAFARVTGDAEAGSFAAGEVSGFDPGNFLDLDVLVTSSIDPSNARADVFSVGVDVAGLNDTGAIAASVGAGAWSLMTSQIGTWRQRMGVVPAPAAGENVSAFVRTFHERGDVSPEHTAFNFGQRGNFDFEQLNSGTEVGFNFEPVPGFNLGAILGKSRGKQTLHDPGLASGKVQADTLGVYGTWIGQRGWYVDASYRAMRFDARTDSAAGRQAFDGTAGAINVETGYAFALGSGLRLEPQFQYTWTTVDGVFVQGQDTWLRTDDGDWHRSRLGLSAWQAFEGAGITWTPYGTLSVVRVDDAKTGYVIGDAFRGNTDAAGTSALVELGVGMHRGGLSGTFGANWTDGGALDSFVGGQLVLRYGW